MGKEKQRPQSWAEKSASIKEEVWRRSFVGFEWCCEWVSYWFSRWAFLEVLEYVGKLGLIGALALWLWKIPERNQAAEDARKTKHYVAWQTLNAAIGKPGNAGRADALQDLNQDGVDLDNVDLSGHAVLEGPLDLTNARLNNARFDNALMTNVNFHGAYLNHATLTNVTISGSLFTGAKMFGSFLNDSTVDNCDFYNVNLQSADLRFTRFTLVNFSWVNMSTPQI